MIFRAAFVLELYFSIFDILSIVLPSDKLKTEHLTRSERIVLAFLGRQTKFFRSQLGLPEEDSDEFEKMKPEFQERMRKFSPKEEDGGFWERCFAIDISNIKSIPDTFGNLLYRVLDEMQQLSLDLLDEAATRTQEKRTGDAEQSET